jgi:hypothetical protein
MVFPFFFYLKKTTVNQWILMGEGQNGTFVFLFLHIHQSKEKREEKIVFEIVGRNHQRVLTDVSRYSLYFAFLS